MSKLSDMFRLNTAIDTIARSMFTLSPSKYVPRKEFDTFTMNDLILMPKTSLTATQVRDMEETFKKQYMQHWDRAMTQTMQQIIEDDGHLLDIPEDACDACKGRGVYNNEVCWHCEGDKLDPTK